MECGNHSGTKTLLGIYLIVLPVLLLGLLLKFWPTPFGVAPEQWDTTEVFLTYVFDLDMQTRFLLVVLLVAGLGSYVHAATSFATYIGNRSFVDSWTWWYILRPPIGVALAMVFYFLIRGGLLVFADQIEVDMKDLYAMAGLAGLVGACSKPAGDKLQEIFNNLFRTQQGAGDDARKDKLGEQLPVKEVMIPVNKITKIDITAEKPENKVTVAEFHDLFKGVVTRIPVFDAEGRAKYVIHESVLFKFIANQVRTAPGKDQPFDPTKITLAEFLDAEGVRALVAESMVFVPVTAKLGEAREAMMKKENCRDAFVTTKGTREERVLGWLTNIEIERYCRL